MVVKRSFLVAKCSPLYHKDKRLTIYAADKVIVLRYPDGERLLTAHTDSITGLYFAPHNPSMFISFGLDGRIMHWDLSTAELCKKHTTGSPIFFADGNYIGHQSKTQYTLKEYDDNFEKATQLYESRNTMIVASGGSEDLPFLAIAHDVELLIYWKSFKLLTRYQLPWSKTERKSITCIAAHPLEAIVATGNAMGEIFVWWGLATKLLVEENLFSQLQPLDDDGEDLEAGSEQVDPFDPIRDAIVSLYNEGHPVAAYPVHPSRVKRNSMHWHCCSVTSVCFTPSGSHLLSGGLEGVMVKWDLTECFGGPRHRRFLPRLGAPVSKLSSPGSHCEDAIVITLENNSFHVLSGSLAPIYTHQGYIQMPRVWNSSHSGSAGSQVPTNFLVLPNTCNDSSVVLTNAGMGALQVVDPRAARVQVNKIDVTHQHAVPRPADHKIPVAYSEVLLVAHLPNNSPHTTTSWLVTYERMAPSALKTIDDQARLTWWRCTVSSDEHQVPKFEPIDIVSLSYLNSPATDLGFVPSKEKDLYLLLEDFRLLIWRANPAFDQFPSYYAPWLMHSCVELNDRILLKSDHINAWGPPRATVIPMTTKGDVTVEANVAAPIPEQFALLITERTAIALYSLASLLKSGPVSPITSLQLNNCSYSQSLPKETRSNEPRLKAVVDEPLLVNGMPSTSPDQTLHHLALGIRGRMNEDKHTGDNELDKTKTRFSAFGLLCLVEIISKNAHPTELRAVYWEQRKAIACLCTHGSQPLVAIALVDGTVVLSEVCTTIGADSSITTLHQLHQFPSLASHPLCDRKFLHRGGLQKLDSKSIRNTVKTLRLAFLSDKNRDLAGLVETIFGRQEGRRDLVLINMPFVKEQNTAAQPVAEKQRRGGLLRLAEPAPVTGLDLPAAPTRVGRKRTSSTHIDDALRQVSLYPIATAPPPEQLLRQLMREGINYPHM